MGCVRSNTLGRGSSRWCRFSFVLSRSLFNLQGSDINLWVEEVLVCVGSKLLFSFFVEQVGTELKLCESLSFQCLVPFIIKRTGRGSEPWIKDVVESLGLRSLSCLDKLKGLGGNEHQRAGSHKQRKGEDHSRRNSRGSLEVLDWLYSKLILSNCSSFLPEFITSIVSSLYEAERPSKSH